MACDPKTVVGAWVQTQPEPPVVSLSNKQQVVLMGFELTQQVVQAGFGLAPKWHSQDCKPGALSATPQFI